MKQSPQQGTNRTGIMTAGPRAEEMVAATGEFRPSSDGTAQAIGEVRVAYAREGHALGEMPPPAGGARTGNGEVTLLLDKLGERLAFERAGSRLYEALLSKHRAYGSFDGGPGADDVLHILQEEYAHADLLQEAIEELGGDPTAMTPSANLASTVSAGLPQALADPRTNLLQSLEAIVVAELADNECWTTLAGLAAQAGREELVDRCRQAIEHERDHLRNVRRWIAAGHGRPLEAEDGEDFTFAEKGPMDGEGFAMSEEEAAEGKTARRASSRGAARPARKRTTTKRKKK